MQPVVTLVATATERIGICFDDDTSTAGRYSDLRCDSNSTTRQREDRRLLLLVSGKRNSKSPAGFGAVPKWHGVLLSWW
jgi:hypothetical protein